MTFDGKSGLSLHAERRGVDQERRIAERGVQCIPAGGLHALAELLLQSLRAGERAVDDNEPFHIARQQAIDHSARRAAGAEHDCDV